MNESNQSLASQNLNILPVGQIQKLTDIINISPAHVLAIIANNGVAYLYKIWVLLTRTWFYVCYTICLPFNVDFRVSFALYQLVSLNSRSAFDRFTVFYSRLGGGYIGRGRLGGVVGNRALAMWESTSLSPWWGLILGFVAFWRSWLCSGRWGRRRVGEQLCSFMRV